MATLRINLLEVSKALLDPDINSEEIKKFFIQKKRNCKLVSVILYDGTYKKMSHHGTDVAHKTWSHVSSMFFGCLLMRGEREQGEKREREERESACE